MRTLLTALFMTLATQALSEIEGWKQAGFERYFCYDSPSSGGSFIFVDHKNKAVAFGTETAWNMPTPLLSCELNSAGKLKSMVWMTS